MGVFLFASHVPSYNRFLISLSLSLYRERILSEIETETSVLCLSYTNSKSSNVVGGLIRGRQRRFVSIAEIFTECSCSV
jgi:hypothetical protein